VFDTHVPDAVLASLALVSKSAIIEFLVERDRFERHDQS